MEGREEGEGREGDERGTKDSPQRKFGHCHCK